MYAIVRLIQKKHVEITLLLAVAAIIIVALLGYQVSRGLWILLAFLALIATISWYTKAYVDAMICGLIAGTYLIVKALNHAIDAETLLFRTGGLTAYGILSLVLVMGPLARFSRFWRKQLKHRRHAGVAVFLLGATHAAILYRSYLAFAFPDLVTAIFTFFGFIALYIFFLMAITSWDSVQKHVTVKQWYVIHSAVLLIFAGLIYYYFAKAIVPGDYGLKLAVILPIAFLIYGVIVAPYSVVRLFFYKVSGWKQLHVLVYIAWTSVIFHAWTAYISYKPVSVQIIFLAPVVLIVGLHAYGWYKKWREDTYFRGRVLAVNKTIDVNGKHYVGVARQEEFSEGQGEKFIVERQVLELNDRTSPWWCAILRSFMRSRINHDQVAVFLFKGQYRAINNLCAHQKGPLYQGLVTGAGYVICPWHQYTFSLKDGKGPPGYTDCVPAYQTLVQDGIVYVATT